MVHRWGYTPNSLALLMKTCGLTEVKQESAQFKLREPRDMRVTGIKPLNIASETPRITFNKMSYSFKLS